MTVTSAGTRAHVGAPMCEVSAIELPSDADSAVDHRGQAVSKDAVRAATMVLTMEREQRSEVVRLVPGSQAKVFTLREALGLIAVLQQRGAAPAGELFELARALHSVRGLAVVPPLPKRRWWQRVEEPHDPLTIVDGHGTDAEAHRRAAKEVRQTAEAVAAGIKAVTTPNLA